MPCGWSMTRTRAIARPLSARLSKRSAAGALHRSRAYAEVQDDTLHLRGLYVTADETHMARGAVTGRRTQAAALGRTLALQLKHQAEGKL